MQADRDNRHDPRDRTGSGRHAQVAAAREHANGEEAAAPGLRLRRISVRERGTVLLLIVGVLAMLSIIAVVYAAIGRADRLSSAAFRRESEIDEFIRRTVDYHLQIISNDVFDTVMVKGLDESGVTDEYEVREPWDAPSVADVTVTAANPYSLTGNGTGTDPWLSPIEPDWTSGSRTGVLDWPMVSAVAPGGAFINLVNFRKHGFETPAGADDPERMSDSLIANFETRTVLQAPAAKQPAQFTRDLRDAFAPAGTDAASIAANLNDPRYRPYSLADADGDGILDSRWWMPEDATDFYSTGVTNPRIRQVIPSEGPYRYVLATRIIDLSGLVNLNTAMDAWESPTGAFGLSGTLVTGVPFGVTPADVDALRLLSLDGLDANAMPPTYDGYSGIDVTYFQGSQGDTPFDEYAGTTIADIGRAAYQGLRETLVYGQVPQVLDPGYGPPPAYARASLYQAMIGGREGAALVSLPGSPAYVASSPFGVATELELRMFNGVNNSDSYSKLEAAMAGRWNPSNGGSLATARLDPLRSSRSTYFERGQRDILDGASPRRGDGLLDAHALQLAQMDIRHLITVLSGARPLATRLINFNAIGAPSRDELTRDDVKINPFDEMFERQPAGVPGAAAVVRGLNQEGVQRVLAALRECLSPFAGVQASWDLGTAPEFGTAAYGGSPEFALHAAAHLLVNWLDAYDDDDIPTRITVEVSAGGSTGAGTSAPVSDPANFVQTTGGTGDWRRTKVTTAIEDNDTPLNPNDDTHARPTDLNQLAMPHSFNVYGIEPQPVLTEVTSFIIFTDSPASGAPYREGGDDEWAEFSANQDPPAGDVNARITIDGDVSLSNPDFLVEVIAFQIANPFSTPVRLDLTDDHTYYLQYGGNYFPLLSAGRGSSVTEVVLGPGDAQVFYVTSQPDPTGSEIDQRFMSILPGGQDDAFTKFVEAQFTVRENPSGVDARPIRISGPFSPLNLDLPSPAAPGVLIDLHGLPATADRAFVNLWRAVIDPDGTSEARGANLLQNDILVDRIHVQDRTGEGLSLRDVLADGPEVTAAVPDEEGTGNNQGFTTVFWRGLKRPSWPTGASSLRGAVPPWAVEVKLDFDQTRYALLNEQVESEVGIGAEIDYMLGTAPNTEGPTYFGTLSDMLAHYADPNGEPPPYPEFDGKKVEIATAPDRKTGNPIPSTPSSVDRPGGQTFADAAIELHSRGLGSVGSLGNPGLFSRPGDLLLMLATGPWNAPELANGQPLELEKEWMTLSEAIALSMDYYSPDSTPTPTGLPPLFYRTGAAEASANVEAKLDRGHLFLDRHVPFVDNVTLNGVRDQGEDVLGFGVPLAWHVLDRFRLDDVGSLTTAKPGVINVNTAPARVLRMVPMLSPNTSFTSWLTGAGVNQLHGADIAGAIAAYRDRDDPVAANRLETLDFTDPDREAKTAIKGLRPAEPDYFPLAGTSHDRGGLFSLGEILAARNWPDPANPGSGATINNIDYLARDSMSLDSDAVESSRYGRAAPGANMLSPGLPDEIPNDYDEQLAIANAALNSLSIRSDVFCVWFVVHGYLPSDVEGLGDQDPLVPSLARRYVMVVDRSNVTKRGDKPRVLFVQEVPM